jgi:hypothetical protein
MRQTSSWATGLAVALCGGFIAIERFAFAPGVAIWIAFGVAVAAVVWAIAGCRVALDRDDKALFGLSAFSALASGWTIVATRTFTSPTALWLALAGGLAMLLVSVRALALRETTAGGDIRSWIDWLTHMTLAVVGGFIVLSTYVWLPHGPTVSPRWLVFGIGIAATCIALGSLVAGGTGQLAATLLTGASAAIGIGLIVTMAVLHDSTARWTAFALGCGVVGVSLVGLAIHERGGERLTYDLELRQAAMGTGEAAAEAA